MNLAGILDRLRNSVEKFGGSSKNVPEKQVEDKKRDGSEKREVVNILGINASVILDALRVYIYKVSGSAEKEAEVAEKGFRVRTFLALGAKIIDSESKVLRLSSKRVVFITSLTVTFAVAGLYGFTSWSVGYTSSEKFCIGCHEMQNAYRNWKASSHYDNQTGVVASCADCHLPTDTISKIKVKTISGVKDTLVHYLGNPEKLDYKELARKARASITNDSCMRCHKNLFPSSISKGGLIAHRALQSGEKKRCTECHLNFVHNVRPIYEARQMNRTDKP